MVAFGSLDRPVHLDRVGRWLTRRPAEVQVRGAREQRLDVKLTPLTSRPAPERSVVPETVE